MADAAVQWAQMPQQHLPQQPPLPQQPRREVDQRFAFDVESDGKGYVRARRAQLRPVVRWSTAVRAATSAGAAASRCA